MQTRTLLAATAVAAMTAIATPSVSRAQDTTAKKQTSKGEVAMSAPNFGSLISAINSSSKHNDAIKGLTDVNAANVQLVNVEDLLKGNDVNALNNALQKNQADITTLQTTLGANSTINAAITATTLPSAVAATDSTAKAATLTPSDVVAADVTADGKVVLYYWKKK
jgi:hypothetical protein